MAERGWGVGEGGGVQHIPMQEFRLGYGPKITEILHWLEYRESAKCYSQAVSYLHRPFTSKLGFWG